MNDKNKPWPTGVPEEKTSESETIETIEGPADLTPHTILIGGVI